ncbi:MAG: hypothetical protein NTY33_02720 [Candidatus Moranbacteria bacterium]|nr:hypothetical protein [Candidatus Moranbacteria bacterium]
MKKIAILTGTYGFYPAQSIATVLQKFGFTVLMFFNKKIEYETNEPIADLVIVDVCSYNDRWNFEKHLNNNQKELASHIIKCGCEGCTNKDFDWDEKFDILEKALIVLE